MKYIVISFEAGGLRHEYPIIFPDHLIHQEVALAICSCEPIRRGKLVRPIAAGQLSSLAIDTDSCYGKSETLQLCSREKVDDALIRGLDYSHGIIT